MKKSKHDLAWTIKLASGEILPDWCTTAKNTILDDGFRDYFSAGDKIIRVEIREIKPKRKKK